MDKTQILAALEQAISEAKSLGANTRCMEALLKELQEDWDGLEELMK